MKVYRGDMAEQGPQPKFIDHGEGCEVITNAGDVRIALSKTRVFDGEMEREFYSTDTYIREDNGWQKTATTKSYPTREAFYQDVFRSDALTQAAREIEEAESLTTNTTMDYDKD